MNDKCASGTGATIDKCFLKVNAPPDMVTSLHFDDCEAAPRGRQVRRLRRDRHRQPHQERHPGERSPLLAGRRHRPAEPLACSRAAARSATACCCSAGPTRTCPSCRSAGACASRRRGTSAATRTRRTCRSMSSSSSPRTRSTTRRLGAVLFGLHEGDERRQPLPALGALHEYITTGRKARLGDSAGPPLAQHARRSSTSSSRSTPSPSSSPCHARARPGGAGRHRPGRRLHVAARPCSSTTRAARSSAKAYQLSKGNPIQDTKELLTQLRDYVETDQGAKLEVMGFGATGYAADVLEQCVMSDVNIVETVAHMMSAVHFFGDVDVICDIGGQDIKVLFMKNGDIANFRLSNSCSAGNGMLLQATADSFGVPVTAVRRRRVPGRARAQVLATAAPSSSTPTASTSRRRASRKEEMLAGLAQVLPKNVWQYVVQIPRMASLGKKFVLQGGTQYNLAAVKAQVDYIKERVPGAEVLRPPAHRRGGRHRRGDGDAARGQAPRPLDVHRHRCGHRPRVHDRRTTRRRVCHFCANNCKRTFIDTTPARRHDQPLHRRLLLREGHRREQGRDAVARRGAQEDRQGVPQPRRLRVASAPSCTSTTRRRCPRTARPSTTSRSRRASSACAASR